MQNLPNKLDQKLQNRTGKNALRSLGEPYNLVDFSSNDYLGFSRNKKIFNKALEILKENKLEQNGSTGSRLLSGNHSLYGVAEKRIESFHKAPAALIFNSGYDANIGFFSSVPKRGDLIIYDELCHASIRDGIAMSHAKAYKFKHNNLDDLKTKCRVERGRNLNEEAVVYIVTEAVFSMDGDTPDVEALVRFCEEQDYKLVVDEAHAIGVLGDQGEGLVQHLGIEDKIFARIITFGKAMGCHGAAILGSTQLKEYLINFARSFIYTTALTPHSVATIIAAYEHLQTVNTDVINLQRNIAILQNIISASALSHSFIPSTTSIQYCLFPGNDTVKQIAEQIKSKGFDVKPILSPTVPYGQERIRFCLHSFNTEEEIRNLIVLITNLVP